MQRLEDRKAEYSRLLVHRPSGENNPATFNVSETMASAIILATLDGTWKRENNEAEEATGIRP